MERAFGTSEIEINRDHALGRHDSLAGAVSWAFALAVCLGLAACSSKSSSSGEGSAQPPSTAAPVGDRDWHETDPKRHVGVIFGFQSRMCACKDKACGDDVTKDMTGYAARVSPDIKLSDAQQKQLADSNAELARCKATLK